MSDLLPEPWEIWHARFNFSEGHGYKFRPVIILGLRQENMLVMMVTDISNKLPMSHDCPLSDWQASGLDKPSIARVDRIAEIPADYLGSVGRIGKLGNRDIAALVRILNQMISEKDSSETQDEPNS